jgi:hypothetical protein
VLDHLFHIALDQVLNLLELVVDMDITEETLHSEH